eukprot:7062194-Ditylum_brightwellii.AAC.1
MVMHCKLKVVTIKRVMCHSAFAMYRWKCAFGTPLIVPSALPLEKPILELEGNCSSSSHEAITPM